MNLFIVRHGEAAGGSPDRARKLTPEGQNEVRVVASQLKNKKVPVTKILHSTRRRAIETAHILAEILGVREIEEKTFLEPNDPLTQAIDMIEDTAHSAPASSLMLVGHLPFVEDLAGYFLGKNPMRVTTATVLWLEQQDNKWHCVEALHP